MNRVVAAGLIILCLGLAVVAQLSDTARLVLGAIGLAGLTGWVVLEISDWYRIWRGRRPRGKRTDG